MKKSVLLINISCICFLFLLSFCKNTKTQKTVEATTASKNNVIASDTSRVSSKQTSVTGMNSGQGIQVDTSTKSTKTNAVIHKAPEQEKIDSIKNFKLKNKMK